MPVVVEEEPIFALFAGLNSGITSPMKTYTNIYIFYTNVKL